jgi:hypothetical protein
MKIICRDLAIEQARVVAGLEPEAIADLVDQASQPTVLGVFPIGNTADGLRWVHTLRGGPVAAADDSQQVAVLAFPTSAASFAVKQVCRCREREREQQRKRLKKLERLKKLKRAARTAAAAE